MEHATQIGRLGRSPRNGALRRLLAGYRFRVCETPEDAQRALDVRRAVYRDECGYDVPVPDEYDARSWFLLAERADTGEAVGSIRMTSRAAGSLEAEEYFRLPSSLRMPTVVEISRFAILPDHRTGKMLMPAVALGLFKGLFKAMLQFLQVCGVQRAVVCAKPERVWTYAWMCFQQTGVRAPYVKLGGSVHELMILDFRYGPEIYEDHRFYDFFVGTNSPEIEMPENAPALGVHLNVPGTLAESA
jgi:hypothetical protein